MKKFSILLFLLCLLIACGQLAKTTNVASEKVSAQTISNPKASDDCELMDFRFLITEDAQYTSIIRSVKVFMDKKAFTEANLKKLFSKISHKHSEAKSLIVIVYTDWEQLSMPIYPEDCPGMGDSENNEKPEKFEYHTARYYRRGENEFFTYNPTLGTADFKKVILKGGKIYRNGAWQEP